MNYFAIPVIILWATLFVGWIMNIMTIAGSSFDVLSGMLILRIVGIFVAPLGAVLGYF